MGLISAAVDNKPPMRDVAAVLKKKLMEYVRGKQEQEAAEKVAVGAAVG